MTAAEQASNSLTELLHRYEIPAANHAVIRRFTDAIAVVQLIGRSKYIEAVRGDGGPNLHINYGFTNGFSSSEEITRVAGNVDREPSTARAGTWVLWHPLNGRHSTSARSADKRREAAFCGCGMQLSLTGVCANCD